MSEETEVDPRYQEPLQPGWWKTAAGWKAVLGSNRVDRRAKPAVVAIVFVLWLVLSVVSGWRDWLLDGWLAVLVIGVVLLVSPRDEMQPLESGWWRSVDGWKRLPEADPSQRGVRGFWFVVGMLLAAITVAIGGKYAAPLAGGIILGLSQWLLPKRFRTAFVLLGGAILIAAAFSLRQ